VKLAVGLLALVVLVRVPPGAGQELPAAGAEAPAAASPRSVVEIQPFRSESSIAIEDASGRRGRAPLIDLNPRVHAWLLLTLQWEGEADGESHHLENADPAHQRLRLDAASGGALVVADADGSETPCALWSAAGEGLEAAKSSRAPYAPLCGEKLYLRQPAKGRRTAREWTVDLLRDHVRGGEQITAFVRDTFFKDAWLATPVLAAGDHEDVALPDAPEAPRLDAKYVGEQLVPRELGLRITHQAAHGIAMGHWYGVVDEPGIFVSAVTPRAISADVLAGVRHPPKPLDAVEAGALVYVVAFDLERFEVGFELGTEHPRVEWSDHVAPGVRDDARPGPDGIGSIDPLVSTGMLSPRARERVVATFTGGFKRTHGAMRWGALAEVNSGSHYGFLVNGVVLSRLQPGLSTAAVFDGGHVELGTWTGEGLEQVRFARQNGVPLIERDAASGRAEPGALVTSWGAGNWSGSKERSLRTLRAGLCLLESGGRRFLAYGYFSSATPSAMARVFQGYGCRYAMHLDMNALEHTYLAIYHAQDSQLRVQHLIHEMTVLDKPHEGQHLPRFLAFPDNRDFFYLLRRSP
jgi:hypothetical protein